ncbi:hyaluronate lyase [Streptococcus phage Javan290]|uniref:hyaluronate lyase N-terminal domain-containing protein n=1 Tax=Streptococcus marmotae TaxID=1825069 RepID=UPI00082D6791|nr:collagen-like protein [Streptococcus marmotae]QBX16932.1 hypothetical protein Javan291_0056 [Streptococcus phage Javan291]QBX26067.1 hyaluronate lyase [Streptococcus phage Javan290]
MTTEKIPLRVQHKRMSASQWASSSLILLEGELGIETDTGKVKVGDGRSRFSALQYLTGPKGEKGDRGVPGETGSAVTITSTTKSNGVTTVRFSTGQSITINDGVVSFEALTPAQKASLKGDKGERGERGEAGPMPTITINSSGIWEINGRSTGVSGRGQAGATGQRGLTGPAGRNGEKGQKGDKGDRGADGAPGQNIVNQRTNQAMKYWFGSKADYDRIYNKDTNTIYDVYE